MLMLYRLLSFLLEMICIPLYPLLYLLLLSKKYTGALQAVQPESNDGIWVHAASVGEVNAVKPLVYALRRKHPHTSVVMTTTTINGLKAAQTLGIPACLSVLDLPLLRRKQFSSINAKLLIVVETEIWANMLYQARKNGIAVVFVNARLSHTSLRRYKLVKSLLSSLQSSISAVLAQTEDDAQRFRQLVDVPVVNTGNLKYAVQLPDFEVSALRKKLGYAENDFIICWGSSRPGEEKLLAEMIPGLKEQIPNLKLIVAPRHLKRVQEVRAIMGETVLFSEISSNADERKDILLIDAMGHLNEFYAICNIAVVGGSFENYGGHNPLEPAFYGKAIIIGPYHGSCKGSVDDLASCGGIRISDKDSLRKDIIELHTDCRIRNILGSNAKACMERGLLSLDKHLEYLERLL